MAESINQALVETTIKQSIKRIQDDPERSTRTLIDMALLFANGKFQQHFFKIIQQMLQDESSSYYQIIPDLIANVEVKRITTFGINLGYNSCTRGARIIRKVEEEQHFNVPWSVFLKIDNDSFQKYCKNYHELFEQGQALGIYTWILISEYGISTCLELAEKYNDHAFIIICNPCDITPALLDKANEIYNIMFVVRLDNNANLACKLLRERKFLYSISYQYSEKEIDKLLNGTIISDLQTLHPVFSVLYPKSSCSLSVQQLVYEYIRETRMKQCYTTVPFDLFYDMKFIDEIISEDAVLVLFDQCGHCHYITKHESEEKYNLFEESLSEILKKILPKS